MLISTEITERHWLVFGYFFVYLCCRHLVSPNFEKDLDPNFKLKNTGFMSQTNCVSGLYAYFNATMMKKELKWFKSTSIWIYSVSLVTKKSLFHWNGGKNARWRKKERKKYGWNIIIIIIITWDIRLWIFDFILSTNFSLRSL